MIRKILTQTFRSGNFQSLAGNAIYSAFSMVTFLLMVRLLSKEMFGHWVLFFTMTAMVDMLRLGLTGTAAIRLISTSSAEEKPKIIGTSYSLGIVTTIIISVAFLIIYFIFRSIAPTSYYLAVFLFYPFASFIGLPLQQASIIAQGEVDFKKMIIIRGLNGGLILLFIISYLLLFEITFEGLIFAYISSLLVLNGIILILKWDHMKDLKHSDKEIRSKILQFGKYSTASYIGSNLLRSSDTIILSLVPAFGINAIAIYSIPMKFVEVVEIPLRSFTAAAFPKLSRSLTESKSKFNISLNDYTVISTVLLIPLILVLALFPDFFLKIMGGANYADSLEVQRTILYLVCIYIFLLPLDRYSGVALFAINRPEYNFYKIIFMLVTNIIFDLIALLVFKSLVFITIASIIFTLFGIVGGWWALHREYGIRLQIKNSFFYTQIVCRLT